MFERLADIERRYEELERLVSDPAVIANRREFAKLARERAQLEETVGCWRERQRVAREVAEHRELAHGKDEELRELARGELPALEERLEELDATLKRHRVQRVPVTETQGRIHTSAVTVAVLPEAEDVEVDLADKELRIDVFRSSGPGGQSVNTTDSAVRVTHLPTGLVVTCQDEKSQHKNKAKALKILRARLLERARHEQQSEIAASRRAMVGSGDRSEKIRTYNFPQSRVTDHRASLTLHTLERVLDGELDAIIDALTTRQQAEALEAAG